MSGRNPETVDRSGVQPRSTFRMDDAPQLKCRTFVGTVFAMLAVCCSASVCVAQSSTTHDSSMTVSIDNDLFTGSDNSYTNGLGVSWVSSELTHYDDEQFVGRWGKTFGFLPFVGDRGYRTYAAWTVAQEMYTPDDIKSRNPPKNDEPYAGVLYVDSILYAMKEGWAHAWELKLGVVGPASHADDVQQAFHHVIGAAKPMGWRTQLPSEPVINVGYTVAHEMARGRAAGSAEWRVVPMANLGLGTYFTGVGLGMYGEFGWNLVDALGGASLRDGLDAASTVGVGPVAGWSVALFCGFAGYGVAHYLPLDGTVFHQSRSVDTDPFIGTGSLGLAVRHAGLVLSLASTIHTETFRTQRRSTDFGTLGVSWFF